MKAIKYLIVIIFLYFSTTLKAQGNAGVRFIDNKPLSEALSLASKEHKLVLLDCYTSWCGPCKYMSTHVFTQKGMGDFINPRFVSIKIDMEKGEGPVLSKKYGIKAYPTFLVLNVDGTIKHCIVGSFEPDSFISEMKKTLEGKGLSEMDAQYKKGERSRQFILDYLNNLLIATQNEKANDVASAFLSDKHAQLLGDSVLFQVFLSSIDNPKDSTFLYVYKNKQQFLKRYPELKDRFFSCLLNYALAHVDTNNKENPIGEYCKWMESNKIAENEEIKMYYDAGIKMDAHDLNGAFEVLKKRFGIATSTLSKQVNLDLLEYLVKLNQDASLKDKMKSYFKSQKDMLIKDKNTSTDKDFKTEALSFFDKCLKVIESKASK